ncbi:MAG: hypothetical protein MPJ24_04485 [Pirellulaceae bacterium]|nr:hypothetical protein [Pirellulaceae bacterium]
MKLPSAKCEVIDNDLCGRENLMFAKLTYIGFVLVLFFVGISIFWLSDSLARVDRSGELPPPELLFPPEKISDKERLRNDSQTKEAFNDEIDNVKELKSTSPVPKQFRGRLPHYYNRLVTNEQRQNIYTIQRRYFQELSTLEAEIASLKKEREDEIEAVLTDEQRRLLQKIKDQQL